MTNLKREDETGTHGFIRPHTGEHYTAFAYFLDDAIDLMDEARLEGLVDAKLGELREMILDELRKELGFNAQ